MTDRLQGHPVGQAFPPAQYSASAPPAPPAHPAPPPRDLRTRSLSGSTSPRLRSALLLIALLFSTALSLYSQAIPYYRPVETAPQEEDIGEGYVTPDVQKPQPRDYWLQITDVVLLAAALALAVWLVLTQAQPQVERWC